MVANGVKKDEEVFHVVQPVGSGIPFARRPN